MVALATIADLEDRLGRTLAEPDLTRAAALLDDASAAVRSYTGQTFTLTTDDTARLRISASTVRLPQRPVIDVTAVADLDAAALSYTWWWGDRLVLSTPLPATGWVDVTYSHGYAEIPGDVVGLVCNQVGRALAAPADQTGFTQEQIGIYSYTIGPAAAAGPFGLLNDERSVLDRYRHLGGAIRIDAT